MMFTYLQVREDEGVRGFDRFRFYGFSDSEIQDLRLQFHSHRLLSGLTTRKLFLN